VGADLLQLLSYVAHPILPGLFGVLFVFFLVLFVKTHLWR
jgi:hypothetical protein